MSNIVLSLWPRAVFDINRRLIFPNRLWCSAEEEYYIIHNLLFKELSKILPCVPVHWIQFQWKSWALHLRQYSSLVMPVWHVLCWQRPQVIQVSWCCLAPITAWHMRHDLAIATTCWRCTVNPVHPHPQLYLPIATATEPSLPTRRAKCQCWKIYTSANIYGKRSARETFIF